MSLRRNSLLEQARVLRDIDTLSYHIIITVLKTGRNVRESVHVLFMSTDNVSLNMIVLLLAASTLIEAPLGTEHLLMTNTLGIRLI